MSIFAIVLSRSTCRVDFYVQKCAHFFLCFSTKWTKAGNEIPTAGVTEIFKLFPPSERRMGINRKIFTPKDRRWSLHCFCLSLLRSLHSRHSSAAEAADREIWLKLKKQEKAELHQASTETAQKYFFISHIYCSRSQIQLWDLCFCASARVPEVCFSSGACFLHIPIRLCFQERFAPCTLVSWVHVCGRKRLLRGRWRRSMN